MHDGGRFMCVFVHHAGDFAADPYSYISQTII
jgi:hypothetical protein